jgi:hypothetical protein
MNATKMKTNTKQFQSDIQPVRQRLEQWRQNRRPGDRIPEELWQAMGKLARVHGVNRVADALRVQYCALRDRVEATLSSKPRADADFIEIPVSNVPSADSGCVVELQDRDGSRLTLRLPALTAADAATLIQAYRRAAV